MVSPLMRRLQALERKLDPPTNNQTVVKIVWARDPEETRAAKLARWRAGDDIEGAPSDIEDRENAIVWMIWLVKPGEVER